MSSTTTVTRRSFDSNAFFSKYAIVLILVGIILLLSILTKGTFLQPQNLLNVIVQVAPIGILARGMMYAFITLGIELSVGSLAALSAASPPPK